MAPKSPFKKEPGFVVDINFMIQVGWNHPRETHLFIFGHLKGRQNSINNW